MEKKILVKPQDDVETVMNSNVYACETTNPSSCGSGCGCSNFICF
jgi:hypothetical protein